MSTSSIIESEHTEELSLLSHLFRSLQLSEPLLKQSNRARGILMMMMMKQSGMIMTLPTHHFL